MQGGHLVEPRRASPLKSVANVSSSSQKRLRRPTNFFCTPVSVETIDLLSFRRPFLSLMGYDATCDSNKLVHCIAYSGSHFAVGSLVQSLFDEYF
jgi:hypothetical protein